MMCCDTAVIFTGGKSSRMGKDKSLLPFGEEPTLAQFQYKRLSSLFEKVYLSTKSDKFGFTNNLILDIYEDASPLVALLSLFNKLDTDFVFVLSVDAPFVDKNVITKLLATEYQNYDAVIAKSPDGLQPLCGIYSKSMLPILEKQYKKNNHKLKELLELSRTMFVTFEDESPFMNLNHPQEYEKALKLMSL